MPFSPILKKLWSDKSFSLLLLNHLFVIYAFFLPLNPDIRKSIFFTILLVWLIFYRNYKETLIFAIKNRVIQSFVAIFLMYAIWMIGSQNVEQGLYFLREAKMYLFPILFYSLTQYSFLPRIFAAFFTGMFINEITSYGIFLEIFPASWSHYGIALDPTPYEYTHLAYGFALSFTLGMVLFNLLKNTHLETKSRWFLGIFLLTATVNIFITGGRIGYILYAVSLSTVLLYFFKDRFKQTLLSIGLILVLVYTLAYQFSPIVQQRIATTHTELNLMLHENNYYSSFGNRIAMWKYSINIIKENFFFGVGLGDHMDILKLVIEHEMPEYIKIVKIFGTNIHSSYFEIMLQFGIIGIIVFGYLFYQIYKYDQPDAALKMIQYLLIFGGLVYGLVNILSRNIPGILWVSMISFSLVKPTKEMLILNKIDKQIVLRYLVAVILFVIVAKMT